MKKSILLGMAVLLCVQARADKSACEKGVISDRLDFRTIQSLIAPSAFAVQIRKLRFEELLETFRNEALKASELKSNRSTRGDLVALAKSLEYYRTHFKTYGNWVYPLSQNVVGAEILVSSKVDAFSSRIKDPTSQEKIHKLSDELRRRHQDIFRPHLVMRALRDWRHMVADGVPEREALTAVQAIDQLIDLVNTRFTQTPQIDTSPFSYMQPESPRYFLFDAFRAAEDATRKLQVKGPAPLKSQDALEVFSLAEKEVKRYPVSVRKQMLSNTLESFIVTIHNQRQELRSFLGGELNDPRSRSRLVTLTMNLLYAWQVDAN